jgi:hypothetical protein
MTRRKTVKQPWTIEARLVNLIEENQTSHSTPRIWAGNPLEKTGR